MKLRYILADLGNPVTSLDVAVHTIGCYILVIIDLSEKGIDINQCLKLFTEEEQLGEYLA